jgi:hypothetical protein
MAIGGFEAASALKSRWRSRPSRSPSVAARLAVELLDLAQRAGIKLKASQIERNDSGNYTLRLPFDQVKHLFDSRPPAGLGEARAAEAIRTGKGMAREIESARSTPGMADQLSPAQAQGKMFLLATDKPGHQPALEPHRDADREEERGPARAAAARHDPGLRARCRQDAHGDRRGDAADARRARHEPPGAGRSAATALGPWAGDGA